MELVVHSKEFVSTFKKTVPFQQEFPITEWDVKNDPMDIRSQSQTKKSDSTQNPRTPYDSDSATLLKLQVPVCLYVLYHIRIL